MAQSVERKLPEIPVSIGKQRYREPALTQNPVPVGWPRPGTASRDSSEATRRGTNREQSHTVHRAKSPIGLGKFWRYAMGLLTMLRRASVVREYPVHIQIESTDACNLHCTSCSRDVLVDKPSILREDQWKKVLNELRPANVNVSGIGEPFLHPKIFDIIRYAKQNGAAINCATNFTRVKGRHRQIVESGIDQLKVSIDAVNRETFLRIRGEDCFDEIVENVRQVLAWRKKLGAKTPSMRFNFALQRFNYLQAADLVDLAAELGVEGIYYQFLSYVDMEDRKTMLTSDMSREQLEEQLAEAGQRAKQHGISTNLDMWRRDFEIFWKSMQPTNYQPNDKACYFPWISTWLGADGWIRPCPIMPWTLDEGRMGHVDEQSFAEIWNGEKYQALREALARGERPTRSCKLCYPQDLYNILSLKAKLLP